jgi:hypothetical protein
MGARLVAILWFALCVLWLARVARAQPQPESQAVRLFREGRAAVKQGNLEEACRLFFQSFSLERANGTLLNLALCEERTGRLTRALEHLEQFLERAEDADDRRPLATRRIADLRRRIPQVTLTLKAGSPAVKAVLLDGVDVAAALGRPLPVDPGAHRLVVVDATGSTRSTAFRLAEGESLVQPLEPIRLPAADPHATAPRPTMARPVRRESAPRSGRTNDRSVGIALLGGGIGAIVASVPATLLVLEKKSIVEDHCRADGCDAEGFDASEAGSTWSTVSTAAVVLGVLGIGAGTYMLLGAAPTDDGTKRRREGPQPRAAMKVGVTAFGPTFALGGDF